MFSFEVKLFLIWSILCAASIFLLLVFCWDFPYSTVKELIYNFLFSVSYFGKVGHSHRFNKVILWHLIYSLISVSHLWLSIFTLAFSFGIISIFLFTSIQEAINFSLHSGKVLLICVIDIQGYFISLKDVT